VWEFVTPPYLRNRRGAERYEEGIDDERDEDAETIEKVLAGDPEAYGALVARYARRIHDLARRMLRDPHEAEDAAQQVFWNAWRALPEFDPRRPFRHWLLRIATNQCRNRLVARRHRPAAVEVGGEEGVPEPAAPAGDESSGFPADDRLESERVRAAIDALPERYRMTVVLRYTQGLSLEAISEITGEPLPTVKTHLHRGREALRRLLIGDEEAGETSRAGGGTT
jgi:RNA polymerase sigma-70 factor (ECF subfamily)